MTSLARTVVLASALAAVTAMTACTAPPDPGETKTTLTIAVDSLALDNWDPIQGGLYGENFTWKAVYDSLTTWDPDSQSFLPRLAREIELSDDRMTMTFTLRDDVTFVDGVHMTAEGVETYFDALLDGGAYVWAGSIAGYDVEFTATGEYTLEMTTSKPIYPLDFWILLGYGTPVLSPGAVEDPERANAEPMGSGPYVLVDSAPEAEATFERNPEYWAPEDFPFDTVVLKVITDETARLNALKSGQVDAVPVTTQQAAEAEESGFALHRGGGYYYSLYVYDPVGSSIEALRDPRVSRAIAMAFDREAIAESLAGGYATVSSQAFIPGQPEYVEGGDDRYPYDVESARDLLAEAGYADGFDVTIPTYSALSLVEPVVQSALAEIGIRVTYESFPDGGAWGGAVISGQYPLVLMQVFNINNLRSFTVTYGTARERAEVPEVLALIDEIKTGSAEDSAAASQELGELVLDDALYIPILRPAIFWASVPEVSIHVTQAVGFPTLLDFQRAD